MSGQGVGLGGRELCVTWWGDGTSLSGEVHDLEAEWGLTVGCGLRLHLPDHSLLIHVEGG